MLGGGGGGGGVWARAILRHVQMRPITFNTAYMTLIHAITAKNLRNSHIKLGVMFTSGILLFPIWGGIYFSYLDDGECIF